MSEEDSDEDSGWTETSTRRIPPPSPHAPEPDKVEPSLPDPIPDLSGGPARRRPRALIARAEAVLAEPPLLFEQPERNRGEGQRLFDEIKEHGVLERLAALPVERIKDATAGNLKLVILATAGFPTVLSVYQSRPSTLMAVRGVGEQTASKAAGAARHMADEIRKVVPVRFDVATKPGSHTALLRAVRGYGQAREECDRLGPALTDMQQQLEPVLAGARATGGAMRWLLSRGGKRDQKTQAVDRLEAFLRDPRFLALEHRLQVALATLDQRLSDDALWADFETHSPKYYGWLGELTGIAPDIDAVQGGLPAELAEAIARVELDTSLLGVSLRGYQKFGAKFALHQRRAILGDEMGLGKTIEALAVMTHLAAHGATHFLVVCPASVTVNWTREITSRSRLVAHRMHGSERAAAVAEWSKRGGVGITTFDTLRHVHAPASGTVAVVVVDEAHYAKNPSTQRAEVLRRWTHHTERVTFLTGTPMENRVDEFRALIDYLQPDLARRLPKVASAIGAGPFREQIAPAYLRRNQEDVLAELPERIDVDEWVELSNADAAEYRRAVLSRNFMAMRRATLTAGGPDSAKLQRLAEILAESHKEGWKVVIFSYFRDVLDVVGNMLNGSAHGPLTGSTPAAQRQTLVDQFSAAPGHAVLLSQIQAGGTGLNMQAASVVVLTEPQWKPSIEDQAIARCHRMGQVRRVQVHRLLAQDSADRRMLDILSAKRGLFNALARDSALKSASPDAVDIADATDAKEASFARLEQDIIDQELTRLGMTA